MKHLIFAVSILLIFSSCEKSAQNIVSYVGSENPCEAYLETGNIDGWEKCELQNIQTEYDNGKWTEAEYNVLVNNIHLKARDLRDEACLISYTIDTGISVAEEHHSGWTVGVIQCEDMTPEDFGFNIIGEYHIGGFSSVKQPDNNYYVKFYVYSNVNHGYIFWRCLPRPVYMGFNNSPE